jgi:bifunctional DNA-binding transcriptional regulator/antitoxin component of YhaV-PrlF toxin-antitoxin module
MSELYRMRIADRRQVTLPQRLLDRLGIEIGDEIGIAMSEHGQRVIGFKGIQTDLLTPEIQRMLDEREKGTFRPTTIEEIMQVASGGGKSKKSSEVSRGRPVARVNPQLSGKAKQAFAAGRTHKVAARASERLMAE